MKDPNNSTLSQYAHQVMKHLCETVVAVFAKWMLHVSNYRNSNKLPQKCPTLKFLVFNAV